VGGAFADLVEQRADAVEEATSRRPEIGGVLTRSDGQAEQIIEGCDLVVELMGGTDPARDYVLEALRAGKPVVTANKQLLAQHGDELFDVARKAGVQLRFEAAVAGVIPVIRVIQESFGATEIEKVFGIVNGTTNFILSEMAASGAAYDDVLTRAQELGYAEADPTEDVNGADAAAKMAILARLAFHTPVTLEEVDYDGIETVQPDDLAYAKELGLSLKLLGVAERRDSGISVRVFPCFLYRGHPLAPIEGPFNAVMVEAPGCESADVDVQRSVPPVVARCRRRQPDLAEDLAVQVQRVLCRAPVGQVQLRQCHRRETVSVNVAASKPPRWTTPSMNRVGVPRTSPDAIPLSTSRRIRARTSVLNRSRSKRGTPKSN